MQHGDVKIYTQHISHLSRCAVIHADYARE